jgi:hypothetical protein
LCPCKVRNKFLVNFWNRTIPLCIPCIYTHTYTYDIYIYTYILVCFLLLKIMNELMYLNKYTSHRLSGSWLPDCVRKKNILWYSHENWIICMWITHCGQNEKHKRCDKILLRADSIKLCLELSVSKGISRFTIDDFVRINGIDFRSSRGSHNVF